MNCKLIAADLMKTLSPFLFNGSRALFGLWPYSQSLNSIHNRQDSTDGVSASTEATAYIYDKTNTE
jgi:hypothetical protein